MLDSFANGTKPNVILLIAGALVILFIGIVYFFRRKNKADKVKSKKVDKVKPRKRNELPMKKVLSQSNLEGELVYGYGKTLLRRSFKLDGSTEIIMSIGPEILTDYHMMARRGASFKFTVSAVDSKGGDDIINIQCHPPGVLVIDGKIRSETKLYNGGHIMMDGIPIRYENGQELSYGKNKLEGRM